MTLLPWYILEYQRLLVFVLYKLVIDTIFCQGDDGETPSVMGNQGTWEQDGGKKPDNQKKLKTWPQTSKKSLMVYFVYLLEMKESQFWYVACMLYIILAIKTYIRATHSPVCQDSNLLIMYAIFTFSCYLAFTYPYIIPVCLRKISVCLFVHLCPH